MESHVPGNGFFSIAFQSVPSEIPSSELRTSRSPASAIYPGNPNEGSREKGRQSFLYSDFGQWSHMYLGTAFSRLRFSPFLLKFLAVNYARLGAQLPPFTLGIRMRGLEKRDVKVSYIVTSVSGGFFISVWKTIIVSISFVHSCVVVD